MTFHKKINKTEKQIHKFYEWKQLKHMEREHQFLSSLFTLKWPRDVAEKDAQATFFLFMLAWRYHRNSRVGESY